MKENNVVQEKSYQFAVRAIKLYRHLIKFKGEDALTRQFLRCSTSIGANIEEGIGAQSRADFISKMSIAYKEARETIYWLRLFHDTDYLTEQEFNSIHNNADELCRLLNTILQSSKNKKA